MLVSPFLRWIERVYSAFIWVGSNLQSLTLLYFRLTWGHQFFLHGLQKFQNIEQTAQFFSTYNFPFFLVYVAALVELVGGFCLFIGFASRLIAVPLIIQMWIALTTVHAASISNLRFLLEPLAVVREAPYPFLLTALLVFVFGPGRVSVDGWLKRWVSRQPRY